MQTTQTPRDVPLDVAVDAVNGVAALLVRVNQANEYFRLENPSALSSTRSSAIISKELFQQQLVLQIPAFFDDATFCVDIAGEDIAGRVSNYQRICFVLPQNDPGIATQPRANAGGAQAVTRGSIATLDGGGSEAGTGSTLATFAWTQIAGPTIALQNANTAMATFAAPNDTGVVDLGFRLTVTDNAGRTSTNDTLVRVNQFTLSDLAGSWFIPEDDGVTARFVITFFADGTYVKGGREDDPECNTAPDVLPDGNGVELGLFDYDPNSGEFQVQDVFVDSDGDCGLFERDQDEQDLQRITVRGNQLDFVEATTDNPGGDLDRFTLTRVPVSAGIVGSWQLDATFQEPVVVTFFENRRYITSRARQPTSDATACGGTEVGTWSVDANGSLTASQIVNTGNCGFINLDSDSTLRVNAGRLEFKFADETVQPIEYYDRLPRPEIINRSALLGAWYLVDALEPPATPSATDNVVLYRSDGTYIFGGNSDDPVCDSDYTDIDPSLAASVDPDGNGAESANWILDPGTGRVLTYGPAVADSDGSCGLFNRFGTYPANSLFATAVDADTLNVGANGDFEGQLVRIPSTPPNTPGADALIGAWQGRFAGELLVFFGDGTFFYADPADNGGIERGNWTLNAAEQLTYTLDSTINPNCIDTVDEDSCSPASTESDSLTFNAARTQFTIPFDGTPGDPPAGFVFDKVQ